MNNSLVIGWEYLTGYSVATDPAAREVPEWPPHPARVYMALAAALFETDPVSGDDEARALWVEERDALRALEALGDPRMILPKYVEESRRVDVTYFVPVNDSAGPHAATIQSCPSITRSRQGRGFPRSWVGERPCYLEWEVDETFDPHRAALDRLCGRVTRLGHSSSLIRMWVVDHEPSAPDGEIDRSHDRFEVDDTTGDLQVRAITPDMFTMLVDKFGAEDRDRWEALGARIEARREARKALAGKGAKERKAEIDQEVEALESERDSIRPRPPARPAVGIWTGYRRVGSASDDCARFHGRFDDDLVILTHVDGPHPAAATSLALTTALRGAILKAYGSDPIPEWITGHAPDGAPLRDGQGHLALAALPFVGHAHADGHVLGLALIFPRWVERSERGRLLKRLFPQPRGEERSIVLRCGIAGMYTFAIRQWDDRRRSVDPRTWTGGRRGAAWWASVAPIVLDRFPKADRADPAERLAWEHEAADIVADSCERIGLPRPVALELGTTSWHIGSPRSVAKRRPLRSDRPEAPRDAPLGDGYPSYPAKSGNAPRPQFHARLRFPEPVRGPVILGAGRFLGYGFCRPLPIDRGEA